MKAWKRNWTQESLTPEKCDTPVLSCGGGYFVQTGYEAHDLKMARRKPTPRAEPGQLKALMKTRGMTKVGHALSGSSLADRSFARCRQVFRQMCFSAVTGPHFREFKQKRRPISEGTSRRNREVHQMRGRMSLGSGDVETGSQDRRLKRPALETSGTATTRTEPMKAVELHPDQSSKRFSARISEEEMRTTRQASVTPKGVITST